MYETPSDLDPDPCDEALHFSRASVMAQNLAERLDDLDETGNYELDAVLFVAADWLRVFSTQCEDSAKSYGIFDPWDIARPSESDSLEALAVQVGLAGGSAYAKQIERIYDIASQLDRAATAGLMRAA